ncbi:MAG: outer membrane protein assembly factor BamA [Bacteriovoracaceae bacterium]|nr:outer membrane protein assembly factor BamA [Bacteriovoracaceae bacterium]
MNIVRARALIIWVLFFVSYIDGYASLDLGPKVDYFKIDILKIDGIKKVEKEAIVEKIALKEGMVVDNYTLKEDLERIYSMKYFDSVSAHHEQKQGKNYLVIKVKERPIISKITILGNDEIDEEDLTAEMKSQEFAILNISDVKSDVETLQKHYEDKGFYLAQVSFKVKKINDENIELVFTVREFDKVKVKKIIFLGNRVFSDDQLKGIMRGTSEEGFLSFMSGSGNFKEFHFQADMEMIKYFYKTKGYLQANLGTPEITISEDRKWVFITLKINEGPRFSVNNITFQGEVLFDENKLAKKISLKTGNTYSEESLRKDIQLLTEMYQDKGYAFANVLRTLSVIPGENKVDVEFSFEKGKIAYFGRIDIKGNTKTRDKVIRRELKIQEGTKFNGTDLRRSKENVARLGFFTPGSITFKTITREDRDDLLDIEISVEERSTGQLSMGAGYSSASKGFLQASIAQINFMGRGQNLKLSFKLSKQSNEFTISFTEPYLFDSKWSAGVDLYRSESSISDSYEYEKKGAGLRVGHPIFEYTRMYVSYKFEDTKITKEKDETLDLELENGTASTVRTSVVFDKRDNRFEPSKGGYFSASYEYTGLGGKKKWQRYELEGRYFYRVYGDLIFRSRLFFGKLDKIGGQEIPRNEKYLLGGSRNLRGYLHNTIGPTKTVAVTQDDGSTLNRTFHTGGLFTTFAALELEHPLAREAGLKWVVFFDMGNVYDKYMGKNDDYSLKADYGIGFRWFSPIGVLRFELGWPIGKDSKQGSNFNFDIGQLF